MDPNEPLKAMPENNGEEFRSIEAKIDLQQKPLKILVIGSLYLNYELKDVQVVKVQKPGQNANELILELTYLEKKPSEKKVFNIFLYNEEIPDHGTYATVKIVHGNHVSDPIAVEVVR